MEKSIDIFIRTYDKDLKWLKYCLRSIYKFGIGYRNIIICIPESQVHLLEGWNLTNEKIVTCPDYKDDYLGQQIEKIYSWQHSDADIIMFVDSDLIFHTKLDVNEYLKGDQIQSYKTDYSKVEGAICWKPITEKAIGQKLQYEYMRRHCFLYYRDTLIGCIEEFKRRTGKELSDYIKSQALRQFSEFNYVSAYADLIKDNRYNFQDTETIKMPDLKLKQYWSWSNLTNEELNEIEGLLK